MSGSRRPRRGEATGEIPETQAFRGVWLLACALLSTLGAGCPYPQPVFEDNRPFEIVSLTPAQDQTVYLNRACPPAQDRVTLSVDMDDPDGDELRFYYYVNYKEGSASPPDQYEFPDFVVDACNPELNQDKPNIIEVLVMDRAPVESPPRTVSDGGYWQIIDWTIFLTAGTSCDCPSR